MEGAEPGSTAAGSLKRRARPRRAVLARAVVLTLVVAAAVIAVGTATDGSWATAGAAGVLVALMALGWQLWWDSSDREKTKGDLGRALLVGGVLAIAVGWVQFEVDQRFRDLEDERQRLAEQESLALTLGLSNELARIDLSGQDLAGFYLPSKDLHDGVLSRANLRGANLYDANLGGAKLDGTDLRSTDLTQADLDGAHLQNADLSGADLEKVDFGSANLRGANLRGTNLRGASLGLVVNLRESDLTDSEFDAKTQWPDGFNPLAMGASKVR